VPGFWKQVGPHLSDLTFRLLARSVDCLTIRTSRSISRPAKMIWYLSLNLQVAITSPNSRSQRVRSETFAPKPREPGPNPNSQSSYQSYHDGGQCSRSVVGLPPPFTTTSTSGIAALHESGCGRYCCKSPKLPGANFPAVKKSDRRPLIRVPSIALPRSSASLSSGDEVPHIFIRKSRLKPEKFLIASAKRLLQQYRHKAA
jgi:hypothetical protein